MIKLDTSLFNVEIVRLKTVSANTTAGTISYIDEASTKENGRETHKKETIPFAIARTFIARTKKVTKYLKPTLCAIVRYGEHVVAMERHPLSSMGVLETESVDGTMRVWEPIVQQHLNNVFKPMINSSPRDWFFDGRYAYTLASDSVSDCVRDGAFLTTSGNFRTIKAHSLDLYSLENIGEMNSVERSCLAFVTSTGQFSVSPPIWKDLATIGKNRLDESDEDSTQSTLNSNSSFDQMDEKYAVNLSFALKAASQIGSTFGYDKIEPLQIPRLMIELSSVNLNSLSKAVKNTYDCGTRFTHALAWLLGILTTAKNIDELLPIRALLKHLTSRGIFDRNLFNPLSMFQPNMTVENIVAFDSTAVQSIIGSDTLKLIMERSRRGSRNSNGVAVIGTLLTED